jgi:hypothetical protein
LLALAIQGTVARPYEPYDLQAEFSLQYSPGLHLIPLALLSQSMVEKAESINRQETLAGWETTPYASVHQLRRQLMPYTGEMVWCAVER